MIALIVAGVVLLAVFVFVESAGRGADPAAGALPQPRLQRQQRGRLHRRLRALRGDHLPPALPPGRQGPQPDHLGAADHADDGRPADHLDRERAADQPLRPLQAVPDRRHRDHGRRARAALHACTSTPRRSWSPAPTCSCSGSASGSSCRCSCSPPRTPSTTSTSGVASSGSTLFRQIGGSIGVSLFGAIFANQLASNLASEFPAGAHVPAIAEPGRAQAAPARASTRLTSPPSPTRSIRSSWSPPGSRWSPFSSAWLLPELPLKTTAQAPDAGDGLPPRPRRRLVCARSSVPSRSLPAASSAGSCTNASPPGPGWTWTHRSCGCSRGWANARP